MKFGYKYVIMGVKEVLQSIGLIDWRTDGCAMSNVWLNKDSFYTNEAIVA